MQILRNNRILMHCVIFSKIYIHHIFVLAITKLFAFSDKGTRQEVYSVMVLPTIHALISTNFSLVKRLLQTTKGYGSLGNDFLKVQFTVRPFLWNSSCSH